MASFKKGVYETYYGNSAVVSGPKAKSAFDLDAGQRIPISEVNPNKWLRPVENADGVQRYRTEGF